MSTRLTPAKAERTALKPFGKWGTALRIWSTEKLGDRNAQGFGLDIKESAVYPSHSWETSGTLTVSTNHL